MRIILEDRENINQAEERLLRELQSIELIGEIDFSYKDVETLAIFVKDKIQSDINEGTDFLETQTPLDNTLQSASGKYTK